MLFIIVLSLFYSPFFFLFSSKESLLLSFSLFGRTYRPLRRRFFLWEKRGEKGVIKIRDKELVINSFS
jgi:hypothetical protein